MNNSASVWMHQFNISYQCNDSLHHWGEQQSRTDIDSLRAWWLYGSALVLYFTSICRIRIIWGKQSVPGAWLSNWECGCAARTGVFFSHMLGNFINLSHLTGLSVFSSTLSGHEIPPRQECACESECKMQQEHHLLVWGFPHSITTQSSAQPPRAPSMIRHYLLGLYITLTARRGGWVLNHPHTHATLTHKSARWNCNERVLCWNHWAERLTTLLCKATLYMLYH